MSKTRARSKSYLRNDRYRYKKWYNSKFRLMVRNIIFAIALLIFVNWLLNLARINELKREIDQIEDESLKERKEGERDRLNEYVSAFDKFSSTFYLMLLNHLPSFSLNSLT